MGARFGISLALLLTLAPLCTAEHLLLAAVVPDLPGPGPGDEAVALGATAGSVNLDGWSLWDGQRRWPLPAIDIQPGALAWFVGNETPWMHYGGPEPAAAWPAGALHLANDGDEVAILDATGTAHDVFSWGFGHAAGAAVRTVSPGLVYQRNTEDGAWVDADNPSDWVGPRMHRVGESSIAPAVFSVPEVTFYASPDATWSTLTGLVASARDRVHLHVYSLRSLAFADELAAAKLRHPELDLAVHVAGNALGTSEARREAAQSLQRVADAGGVMTMAAGGRYAYHHLKVLVVDDAVAIQSENLVDGALATDGSWGNRGWGVVLHGADSLADWFVDWMAQDRSAWDAVAFDQQLLNPLGLPVYQLPPARGGHDAMPARRLDGPFTVTPVLSPDHTARNDDNPILAKIAAARHRVWTQQLQLNHEENNRLGWQRPDGLLVALLDAARRGVDVRVQVPGSGSVSSPATAAAVALLEETARAEDLSLEVRYFQRSSMPLLHNKGFIIDDALVVGSQNGNFHSRAANREVSVIVEGPGAADYHARLFVDDWAGSNPRDWSVIAGDLQELPAPTAPLVFLALAMGAFLQRRQATLTGKGLGRSHATGNRFGEAVA